VHLDPTACGDVADATPPALRLPLLGDARDASGHA
jgi:hypothetical protein